jgi:hypothetical protein
MHEFVRQNVLELNPLGAGNANLQIGGLKEAIQENGAPR